MTGSFVEALRRERESVNAMMFERIAPYAEDDEDHLWLADELGILPPPSGRTVGARTALWMVPT